MHTKFHNSILCRPQVNDSVGLMVVLLAWSVTEVIRYAFYACSLIGNTPPMLTYMRLVVSMNGDCHNSLLCCRYTLFYVLYPTGVTVRGRERGKEGGKERERGTGTNKKEMINTSF